MIPHDRRKKTQVSYSNYIQHVNTRVGIL
jgi:hypothetical protein